VWTEFVCLMIVVYFGHSNEPSATMESGKLFCYLGDNFPRITLVHKISGLVN
jgi:hypothetical protein